MLIVSILQPHMNQAKVYQINFIYIMINHFAKLTRPINYFIFIFSWRNCTSCITKTVRLTFVVFFPFHRREFQSDKCTKWKILCIPHVARTIFCDNTDGWMYVKSVFYSKSTTKNWTVVNFVEMEWIAMKRNEWSNWLHAKIKNWNIQFRVSAQMKMKTNRRVENNELLLHLYG